MPPPVEPARLFGPGSPPTGELAQLSIGLREIEIESASGAHRMPLASLRMRVIGGGRTGIELAWDVDGSRRVVHVFDPGSVAALRTHPALAPAVRELNEERRRGATGRALGWSALALFLLSPLLLALAFVAQADRIAGLVAGHISPEQETAFGNRAFTVMQPGLELEDTGPQFEALSALGERLTLGSRYGYRFMLARGPEVNAFALPGGIVVVYTGLLQATRRPEELAGVLAHEVQHVELRHSLRAAVKQLGLRGLWALLAGDLAGGWLSQAGLELTSLSFSRDAESQADSAGFDALVQRGIDPEGMADFFGELARQEGARAPQFFSSHPASEQRARALRERAFAMERREFEPLAFSPWPPPPAAP